MALSGGEGAFGEGAALREKADVAEDDPDFVAGREGEFCEAPAGNLGVDGVAVVEAGEGDARAQA